MTTMIEYEKPTQSLSPLYTQITQIRDICGQELIVINEDKLELLVSQHLSRAEKRYSWCVPAGIFISLLATLLTATFKDSLSVSSQNWQAIFQIACICSAFWMIVQIAISIKYYKSKQFFADEVRNRSREIMARIHGHI